MIAVLCPSRGRPEQLKRSIESLRETADDLSNIEILVAWDYDDDQTMQLVKRPDKLGISMSKGSERLGYDRLYDYYNSLATLVKADWYLLWNDDAIMTTQGWDTKIEELPPEIMVGDIQHYLSPTFCCFPVMRRQMYDILGHFSGPTPHVDSYIQDIGRALGAIAPVDAFVEHAPDKPDHAYVPDQTYNESRGGLRHQHYFSPEFQAVIAADTEKVRKALDG